VTDLAVLSSPRKAGEVPEGRRGYFSCRQRDGCQQPPSVSLRDPPPPLCGARTSKPLWMRFGAGCACRGARIDCESVCFGWSRAASLKNLDHPKQTALPSIRCAPVRAGQGPQVKRSGTSLDAAELASNNCGTVLVDQNGHQNRSKVAFLFGGVRTKSVLYLKHCACPSAPSDPPKKAGGPPPPLCGWRTRLGFVSKSLWINDDLSSPSRPWSMMNLSHP
jgi:hypothetical protein